MNSLSLYKSVKQSNESLQIDVDLWLGMIKHHHTYSGVVLEARKIGKGDPVYDAWKLRELPCVMPNFIFRGRRINDNIVGSTGLIYVDYDCEDEEQAHLKKIELMQMEYTYAAWISLSGHGVGSLIKVEGLSLDNFKQFYETMVKDLNLQGWDKHAATPNRPNVLSYDPNIFINPFSQVYSSSLALEMPGLTSILECPLQLNIVSPARSLVFQTTLPEYNEDCVYIPEGRPFFAATLPFRSRGIVHIPVGKREAVLSAFTNNLVILNPQADHRQIFNILNSINQSYCQRPISNLELNSIIAIKIKNRENLKPLRVQLKKYWTNPNSPNRWQAYINKRKEPNRLKLEEFLADELFNLTKPVTLKDVSKLAGIPYATLKRHAHADSEYRRIIDEFNSSCKTK